MGLRGVEERSDLIGVPEGDDTMLHAWSKTMDSRRALSLLLAVGGIAVAALGMAASPELPPIGISTVGPIVLGAAMGGYVRHRGTDRERAPLWALAYGAGGAATIVATFGTAILIRPTVRDISGLGDVWSGLMVGGFLVSFVGAFLWERDARVRRFAAPALLGLWLVVGGVFASMSGEHDDPDHDGQIGGIKIGHTYLR